MKFGLRALLLMLGLWFGLQAVPPAVAYPCFYEMNAPVRLGGGQTLLSGVVDTATGALFKTFTCVQVPGPVTLNGTIYFRNQDNSIGPFGKGTSCAYDFFIRPSVAWPGSPYVLITPGNRQFVFDAAPVNGNYIDSRDPALLGATLSFTNQPAGTWCTLRWKSGLQFRFDTSGGLIAIVDRFNNTVTITHNTINGFVAMVYLNGNTSRYVSFPQDTGSIHVVKVQAVYSPTYVRRWNVGYDVAGKMATLTDPNSKSYTFTYSSYTRSDGVVLPLIATINDGRGMMPISAHYDTSGRVTSLDNQLGGSQTFAYSAAIGANGTVTGTDADGHGLTFTFAWNPYGHSYNVSQVVDNAKNETTTIVRNNPPTYLPTSTTDFRGRTYTYAYNAAGDLTSYTYPNPAGGPGSGGSAGRSGRPETTTSPCPSRD